MLYCVDDVHAVLLQALVSMKFCSVTKHVFKESGNVIAPTELLSLKMCT